VLDIVTLPSIEAGDTWDEISLANRLSKLINDVYAVAEDGLWVDGASRTSVEGVADLMRAGQISVALVGGEIVGCVRVQLLGSGVGEFGMLAVDEGHRSAGVGRNLVRFAEQTARDGRCESMQLEVLVPRGWSHPSKEFLIDWYTRLGYAQVRIGAIEKAYPELAPFLATPCDLMIYRKDLWSGQRQPGTP